MSRSCLLSELHDIIRIVMVDRGEVLISPGLLPKQYCCEDFANFLHPYLLTQHIPKLTYQCFLPCFNHFICRLVNVFQSFCVFPSSRTKAPNEIIAQIWRAAKEPMNSLKLKKYAQNSSVRSATCVN